MVAAVVACMSLISLGAAAVPARAQDGVGPVQLMVTVVLPSDAAGPRPTGGVTVSVDGRRLVSIPLVRGLASLTSITPQLAVALALVGRRVTIRYSGDSNYEASAGISVTLPTSGLLTIVARPRDAAPPSVEIRSPADGRRYGLGEGVVADYACHDPDGRSAVTTCEGPVASGAALDTAVAGTFSFTVRAEDARGNATSQTVTYAVRDETDGSATSAPEGTTGNSGSDDQGGAPSVPASPPPASAVTAPPALAPARLEVQPQPGLSAAAPVTRRSGSSPRNSGGGARTPAAPVPGVAAAPVAPALASFDPRADPAKTVGILVAAFTLLQLGASTGGLALARGGGGVARTTRRQRSGRHGSEPAPDSSYDSVGVEFLSAGLGAVAVGDRSRTWSWPGTRRLDALSVTLPARLSGRSPLLARIAADGTYLRAILGSASLLGLLAGLALGVAALRDTGGDALPPVATLTIAIAVLGVLDAAAGLVAVLIFTIGVLVLGGVDSSADLRLVLSLDALWVTVPMLAGAARPLRRPPTRSLGQSWDRAADFVIASLIGAWAVNKIILALPGVAGRQLAIAEHADAAAYCVLAALVVRLAAETIAAHLYPQRLDTSEAADVPQPGELQRLGASVLRTALFVFFAHIVVGSGWQLWAAAALFIVPQILAVYEERFPNSPALSGVLPRGLLALVLMLFVVTAVGAVLLDTMNEHSKTFLADTFVILALPGFVLSLLSLFGRTGDEAPIGWGKRVAGLAVLITGVLLVLGLLL
jgi:hypothetical protein